MIVDVARLTVWEWYKLRRRWMPYILVAVAVVLTQLLMWLGYSAYHNQTMQQVFSGGSSSYGFSTEVDGELVEMVELSGHPWYVGCQFHPEFTSNPRDGHRLFEAFVRALTQSFWPRASRQKAEREFWMSAREWAVQAFA